MIGVLTDIAIIASPIISLCALIWTIVWSRKVLREAKQTKLLEHVEELAKQVERLRSRVESAESRIDALPTEVAIQKIDGDIREMKAGINGMKDIVGGLNAWMERMDSYLHDK